MSNGTPFLAHLTSAFPLGNMDNADLGQDSDRTGAERPAPAVTTWRSWSCA